MKMKFPLFAALLSAAFFSASCSDDDVVSTSPVFKAITIAPQPVYTGQYAYATVSYEKTGSYIYESEYSYSVTGGASGSWSVVDPTASEPKFRFQVPDNPGTCTVTFKADRIKYSAMGSDGTIYGSANTLTANVRILQADVVNANWGDTRVHLDSVIAVKDSTVDGQTVKVWTGNVLYGDKEFAPTLTAVRMYGFDERSQLCRMTETAAFDIKSHRNWNDELNGVDGGYEIILDDAVNCKAFYSLLGAADVTDKTGTVSEELEGDDADKYPVSSWNAITDERQMAAIVNAFVNGGIAKYSCTVKTGASICRITVQYKDNQLVFERAYTKLNG